MMQNFNPPGGSFSDYDLLHLSSPLSCNPSHASANFNSNYPSQSLSFSPLLVTSASPVSVIPNHNQWNYPSSHVDYDDHSPTSPSLNGLSLTGGGGGPLGGGGNGGPGSGLPPLSSGPPECVGYPPRSLYHHSPPNYLGNNGFSIKSEDDNSLNNNLINSNNNNSSNNSTPNSTPTQHHFHHLHHLHHHSYHPPHHHPLGINHSNHSSATIITTTSAPLTHLSSINNNNNNSNNNNNNNNGSCPSPGLPTPISTPTTASPTTPTSSTGAGLTTINITSNSNGGNGNNSNGSSNNPLSRPSSARSPYEWIKKPSYTSQPQPGKTRTRDKYRVVYSDHQRLELEKEFHSSHYITIKRKSELAFSLSLTERQVKIWFQNRRAKERKQLKKKEELLGKSRETGHQMYHPDHHQPFTMHNQNSYG